MKTKTRGILIYGLIFVFLLSIVSPGLAAPSNQQEPAKTTSVFKDVSNQDTNLAYIIYLNNQGIIKGFPDGNFHPGEGLTRAQAASIMVLAGKIKVNPSQTSPFADVGADHWARASIAAAVQAGYISGFPDKSFHPEDKLSRAQAISMILRLSKQSLSSAVLPKLSDMNNNHWAAPAVAVGIASGMLDLSADQKQVYPEQAISRGDLSRALGILLTQDPDLSSTDLVGNVQVKSGTVTIQSSNQAVKTVTGSSVIVAGDIISTDKSSEADISYNDGSGLLLTGDSQLIIKEARGRSYIKADGSAGIAIDWLLLDLKQGQMFGALATSSSTQESPTSTEKKTTSYLGEKQLLASLNGRDFLAAAPANGQNMPWYEASKTKKVKVEVDMPWGVAAIRGTFWNNMVNASGGGSTSILTGSGEVTAGGQTVSLGALQATQGTGGGLPPSPPQPMTPSQMGAWTQAATWAQGRAAAIQQNQGAPPPNALNPTPVNIVQAINQALSQAQAAAGSLPTPTPNPNQNQNQNSSNNQLSIEMGSIPNSVVLSVYNQSSSNKSISFTVNPANAQISYSFTGDDVVDVSMDGSGTAARHIYLSSKNSIGTEVITFTAAASGYTSITRSITVHVMEMEMPAISQSYLVKGYTSAYLNIGSMTGFSSVDDQVDIKMFSLPGMLEMGNEISNIHLYADGGFYAEFGLAAGLAEGKYCFIVYRDSLPIAWVPFEIQPFKLNAVIIGYNPNLTSLSYPVHQTFIFNNPIDPASINIPGISAGGSTVPYLNILSGDGSKFSELGLGQFLTDFSFSNASTPTIQGEASLSGDGKVLQLLLSGDAGGGYFTLASGLFTPANTIKDTIGNTIDTNSIIPPSITVISPDYAASVQSVESITGTAVSNQNIEGVKVKIFKDGDGITYLHPDGEGGWSFGDEEAWIPAETSTEDWSTWTVELNEEQQSAIKAYNQHIYIEVGLIYADLGDTIYPVSSSYFIIDNEDPTLSIGYPFIPPNGETNSANGNLIMYFIEEVQPVSGEYINILNSDYHVIESIEATANLISIETNSGGESTVTINPTVAFNSGQFYVEIDEGAFVDLAGNPYAGINNNDNNNDNDWSFTAQ